jgi:hypothetical protein
MAYRNCRSVIAWRYLRRITGSKRSRIMRPYNGHRSWNAWNVSLWINNDEGLYRLAQECCAGTERPTIAARRFIEAMDPIARTPDGARYNLRSVTAAMRGFIEE